MVHGDCDHDDDDDYLLYVSSLLAATAGKPGTVFNVSVCQLTIATSGSVHTSCSVDHRISGCK